MAVEPHKHCPVCNKPIPLDELTCSKECEILINARQEQSRKSRTILFIILIVFIIVWAYMTFFK